MKKRNRRRAEPLTSELMLESASRLQAAPCRFPPLPTAGKSSGEPGFNVHSNPLRQFIGMASSRPCHTSTVTNITVTRRAM